MGQSERFSVGGIFATEPMDSQEARRRFAIARFHRCPDSLPVRPKRIGPLSREEISRGHIHPGDRAIGFALNLDQRLSRTSRNDVKVCLGHLCRKLPPKYGEVPQCPRRHCISRGIKPFQWSVSPGAAGRRFAPICLEISDRRSL